MLRQRFYLKHYSWEVVVLYEVDKDNINEVMKILTSICNDDTVINKAFDNISANKLDTGFAYSNFNSHKTLIIISKGSSKGEVLSTIAHEANHLQSHIATVYGLDEKGEEVSYLMGTIIKNMYKVFRKIICS